MRTEKKNDNAKFLAAIPVYNERPYIRGVIARVRNFASNILVVDDGSTDGSREILEEISMTSPGVHIITHSENQGYGQSLIDAFQFAICNEYDYIVTLDCDEQHEPEDIPNFIRAFSPYEECGLSDQPGNLPLYDIVSGSRYLQPPPDGQIPPPDRYAINMEITKILNKITQFHLTDSFCGFKAYSVEALKRMDITEKGYGMPLQLWIQASKLGLRVKEIPVKLIYKDMTRTFGAGLNDPSVRLSHYKKIIERELERDPLICRGVPVFSCSPGWPNTLAKVLDDFRCGSERACCVEGS